MSKGYMVRMAAKPWRLTKVDFLLGGADYLIASQQLAGLQQSNHQVRPGLQFDP